MNTLYESADFQEKTENLPANVDTSVPIQPQTGNLSRKTDEPSLIVFIIDISVTILLRSAIKIVDKKICIFIIV